MAFGYPNVDLFNQAVNQNPTQAAAAGLTQTQSMQAPYGAPASQGLSNQIAGNVAATGKQPGSGQAANPGNYNTGGYLYGSNQWYGKNNEYGTQMMANDPGAFWGGYSEDVMGLAPGSQAGSFLAGTYNPAAIGQAMWGGGKGFVSDDQKLAGMTAIANQFAGPGTTFINPGMLISTTLSALQKGDMESLSKISPELANIVSSSQGNPAGQVSNLVNFFKEALAGSMPQDTLQAFLNQIMGLGQVYISQIRKDPNIASLDQIGTFASFLTRQLGPSLGL